LSLHGTPKASIHHVMKTIILMSLLTVLCTTAHAQDPVKTSPQYYKVLLENDQVRVLEYRLKGGGKRANAFAFGWRRVCPERCQTQV
jgi:hypothetical protein